MFRRSPRDSASSGELSRLRAALETAHTEHDALLVAVEGYATATLQFSADLTTLIARANHARHPQAPALAALGTLHIETLAALPARLLAGDPGAPDAFRTVVGHAPALFTDPVATAADLLGHRINTALSVVGQVLAGMPVTPEDVAQDARRDLHVTLEQERGRRPT